MLTGKIAIVTGGAKGIGRYAAHTLAQAGATVVVVDVDVERMHKTLGELRDLKFEAWALAASNFLRRFPTSFWRASFGGEKFWVSLSMRSAAFGIFAARTRSFTERSSSRAGGAEASRNAAPVALPASACASFT